MIQSVQQCEHAYKTRRTINSRDKSKRTQYQYCAKCGHARKHIIEMPVSESRIHFRWVWRLAI